MAIDTAAERITATNFLVGLRILFPTGSIDQSNRQAAARTVSAIFSIPSIVYLDGPIDLRPAVSATYTISFAVDSALSVKPAVTGTPGVDT